MKIGKLHVLINAGCDETTMATFNEALFLRGAFPSTSSPRFTLFINSSKYPDFTVYTLFYYLIIFFYLIICLPVGTLKPAFREKSILLGNLRVRPVTKVKLVNSTFQRWLVPLFMTAGFPQLARLSKTQ